MEPNPHESPEHEPSHKPGGRWNHVLWTATYVLVIIGFCLIGLITLFLVGGILAELVS